MDIATVGLMPLDRAGLAATATALKRWPVKLLAESMETGDVQCCQSLAGELQCAEPAMINVCLTQALAWASNIGRENN